MHRKFYLWLSILSGVVLLVFTIIIGQNEMSPEYKFYQTEYKKLLLKNSKDEAVKKAANNLEVGLRQIYLGLGRYIWAVWRELTAVQTVI